ncbi:hypothetical protein [Agrobacterium rosae]|uniref:hypothetical protein n=1 Tax=Agrobacterium rosae TaxID=1972867 RepID=UPI003A81242B
MFRERPRGEGSFPNRDLIQYGNDVDVGCGEPFTRDERLPCYRELELIQRALEAAITKKELLFRKRNKSCALVGKGLLHRTCGKEHLTIIVGFRLVEGSQVRRRKEIGAMGNDRSALADDMTVMLDLRYLTNRIDLPEKATLRIALVGLGLVERCAAPRVARAHLLAL